MIAPPLPLPVAIVTGGAKRIGAALVRALAADGWHVVIHCHTSVADAEALAAELVAAGGSASVVVADLADPAAAETIVAAGQAAVHAGSVAVPPATIAGAVAGSATPATGTTTTGAGTSGGTPPAAPGLRLMVNSASRFDPDGFGDFTVAQWDRHLAVNLRAPALLIQAFAAAVGAVDVATGAAPSTGSPGEPAVVVNLLDAKLASLNPDFLSYTVSKIGLAGLTELAARAYAPRLRVAAIAPAVTMVSGPQSRDDFDRVHRLNPLGRGVEVAEIVAALRFILATPTYNAQTLVLDGGQRLLGLPRDVAYMVDSA